MRGLSLTQPWATACALGSKRIETRSWSTNYRGLVAIHAAKGYRRDDIMHFGCCWNWCGALWATGFRMGEGRPLEAILPFGAIVAVAKLVACRRTEDFTVGELDTPRRPPGEYGQHYEWTERQMGDFSPGRFGFVLADVRALPKPIPCRGALGLWKLPFELITPLAVADARAAQLSPAEVAHG